MNDFLQCFPLFLWNSTTSTVSPSRRVLWRGPRIATRGPPSFERKTKDGAANRVPRCPAIDPAGSSSNRALFLFFKQFPSSFFLRLGKKRQFLFVFWGVLVSRGHRFSCVCVCVSACARVYIESVWLAPSTTIPTSTTNVKGRHGGRGEIPSGNGSFFARV